MRARVAAMLVVAAAACSSQREPGSTRGVSGERRGEDPVARAVDLGAADPALATVLAANDDGLVSDAGFVTSKGFRATVDRRFDLLAVKMPSRAGGIAEIGIGRFARSTLRVTFEGASDVEGIVDRGRVLYRDAYPSTDMIVASTTHRFEQALVLRDEAAPTTFTWRVDRPSGLSDARRERSGAVVFDDATGSALLRIPAAFAIDAAHVRRDAELTWADGRLSVTLDTTGLVYPILLDPGIEVAIWEQRFLPALPPQRNSHAMAYDSVRNRVYLFGGYGCTDPPACTTSNDLNDTWFYDGTTWTRVTTATSPGIREYPVMQFDATRGKMVMFGGFGCSVVDTKCVGTNGTLLDDTWELDGTNWTKLTPADSPSPRAGFGLVFDSVRGKSVLFGGWAEVNNAGTTTRVGDTWEWDGSNWTNVAPGAAPYARDEHAMFFDTIRHRTVLFGGRSCIGGCSDRDDTWKWDGTIWAQHTAGVAPSARVSPATTFNVVRGRGILFGGRRNTDSTYLSDTWEWDGTTWSQMTTSTNPLARAWSPLVYDASRKRAVLFSGYSGNRIADLWEYRVIANSCATNADCDVGFCTDGVCCDAASCGTCQACNTPSAPGTCAPVKSTDDADTCSPALNMSSCDSNGACKKAVGGACPGGNADCASGNCADGYCCNTACAGACDVCAASLGAVADGTCTVAPSGSAGGPSCSPYKCDGILTACPVSCTSDAACAFDAYCNALGKCVPRKAQGSTCNTAAGSDCLQAGCRACNGGSCVSGFCCDRDCTGACETCAQAAGAPADGTCGVSAKGSPGSPTCAPYTCNGNGGACPGSCSVDADCAAGATCDAGKCVGVRDDGQACGSGAACKSGFCADGVCCNAACEGQCEACDVTDQVGTCSAIVGDPRGGRPACPTGSATEPCTKATCNGVERATCAGFVGPSVRCREASCANAVATLPGFCDGKGACPALESKKCEPFACGGTTCKETCTTDADCSQGRCDVASAKCVAAATCANDYTVRGAAGDETPCSPYRCADGACKKSCATVSDCVFPAVCDEAGRCVVEGGEPGGGDGCTVTTGSPAGRPTLGWGVAIAALAILRRRRAR